ncbi:MAG: hypothetical protein KDE27_07630 [Planctomycetes bacterium]|nr:hypothetical protein [Planctomycetota bacterium]
MAEDWKIRVDRNRCDKPGCPLPTSKAYFALLEFPECVRRDLCDACFADYERRCDADKPPVFWRAARRSSASKEPVLDLVSLRALFDRLAGHTDERARALRYFCALLLIRKRVLRMERPRTQEQERADLVVVDPKVKKEEREPILLFAPELDLDNLDGLKAELLAAIGESDESPAEGPAEVGEGESAPDRSESTT